MKRRLPLILVAVAAVVAIVAASIAAVASGVDGSAVALTVNGTKVSQATVDRELEWLAGNQSVAANVQQQGGVLSSSEGSITSAVTASWLTQRIQVELVRQAAAKQGVKVKAADRSKLQQQALDRYPHAPQSARDVIADGDAYLQAFGVTTQDQQNQVLTAALRGADVRVDPRYGRWHKTQGVCPPTGCAAAAATGG
jgi:hypothetical protein